MIVTVDEGYDDIDVDFSLQLIKIDSSEVLDLDSQVGRYVIGPGLLHDMRLTIEVHILLIDLLDINEHLIGRVSHLLKGHLWFCDFLEGLPLREPF